MVGAFVNNTDEHYKTLFDTVQTANDFDIVGLTNSLVDVVKENGSKKI